MAKKPNIRTLLRYDNDALRKEKSELLKEIRNLRAKLDFEEFIGVEERRYKNELIEIIAQCRTYIPETNPELADKVAEVLEEA